MRHYTRSSWLGRARTCSKSGGTHGSLPQFPHPTLHKQREPQLRRVMATAKKLTRRVFSIAYGARVIVSQEGRDRVSARWDGVDGLNAVQAQGSSDNLVRGRELGRSQNLGRCFMQRASLAKPRLSVFVPSVLVLLMVLATVLVATPPPAVEAKVDRVVFGSAGFTESNRFWTIARPEHLQYDPFLETLMLRPDATSGSAPIWRDAEEVKVVNDYQIVFRMKRHMSFLPYIASR